MSGRDRTLLPAAAAWLDEGRKIAVATVIGTWGSAPQPAGSLLIIDADGNFIGSVSGGCVEGEVVMEAQGVIKSGETKILEYGVADETAWKVGLACGGAIRILLEPVTGEGS